MSSFQNLGVFSSKQPRGAQKLKGVKVDLQNRERESMRVTPLGFWLRVIVNEKPLNLLKTTLSVLSVLLLIYDYKVLRDELMKNYQELGWIIVYRI